MYDVLMMLVQVSSKDLKQSEHLKHRTLTWVFSTTRAAMSPFAVLVISAFSYALEFFTVGSCNIQFCLTVCCLWKFGTE